MTVPTKTPGLLDHYAWRARLQPALVTLLPLAAAAFACVQPAVGWIPALWSFLGTTGFTYFLATTARNRGKAIEPALWRFWGGAPTTQLLRHRGPANPELRERWHKYLAKLLGKPMPTADQERGHPEQADVTYEAAIRLLIGKTYDKARFPFPYRDNVNYGFCRNLYGLKPIGVSVSAMGLIICLVAAAWALRGGKDFGIPAGAAVVNLGFLVWWLTVATRKWVQVPAMSYAQHLLQCTEELALKRKPLEASA